LVNPGLYPEHAMKFKVRAMGADHSSCDNVGMYTYQESSRQSAIQGTSVLSMIMISSQILLYLSLGVTAFAGRPTKPNIIFIITDDQDLHLNSLDYQPSVQKHFIQEGTWFKKHFCTVALCCPSRVSLLTGKAAHNTNVTDVSAPYGT
jgi:hypothetical protein